MYSHLLKNINIALLPHYKDKEMDKELQEEWELDSQGSNKMTYLQFRRMLFRIVHWWATNFDLEEYEWLLGKLYERITWKSVIQDGKETYMLP